VRRVRQLLQKRSARWAEGAFVAEGPELIRCALEAGVAVESLYVSPEGDRDGPTQEVCRAASDAGARVLALAPGVLERVADTVTPQPVLAVVPMAGQPDQAAWAPVPGSLVVVLVDVRDPGNAGTVLRAADASGATAVVFAGESVDPYNPKTVRASAGSLFHVPPALRPDAVALAAELEAAGFVTVATVVRGGQDYTQVDWHRPSAVFLGNESAGLTPSLCAELSESVTIPMAGRAESLNVGVAGALLCFEAFRQRRAGDALPRSMPRA
jgi:TrmH family RNA methyltransferase